MLEVAGALTHDLFITISFPQGEGPHVQPPIVLLRCTDVSWGSYPWTIVPQSELALRLVELYKLSKPTLFFIPLKSDLK